MNGKQVEFIPTLYANIEHLVIQETPIQTTAATILRHFMIAAMPKLKSFNQVLITPNERQLAEKAYQPFFNTRSRGVKAFTTAAAKLSKQINEDNGGGNSPPKSDSMQMIGGIKFINESTPPMKSRSSAAFASMKNENKVSYEDFSTEFEFVVKEFIAQTIGHCTTGGTASKQ